MMLRRQRIRWEQRARLENLVEKVFRVTDEEGIQQLMVMIKNNGTLFQLDMTLRDWVTLSETKGHSQIFISRQPGPSPVAIATSLTNKSLSYYSSARCQGLHSAAIWLHNAVVKICSRPRQRRPRPETRTRSVNFLSDNQHKNATTGTTWTAAPSAVTTAPSQWWKWSLQEQLSKCRFQPRCQRKMSSRLHCSSPYPCVHKHNLICQQSP